MMDEEKARLALVAKVAVTIDGIDDCTLYRSKEGKYYLHLEGEFTPKELRRLADAMDGWDENDPTPKPLPAEEQISRLMTERAILRREVVSLIRRGPAGGPQPDYTEDDLVHEFLTNTAR